MLRRRSNTCQEPNEVSFSAGIAGLFSSCLGQSYNEVQTGDRFPNYGKMSRRYNVPIFGWLRNYVSNRVYKDRAIINKYSGSKAIEPIRTLINRYKLNRKNPEDPVYAQLVNKIEELKEDNEGQTFRQLPENLRQSLTDLQIKQSSLLGRSVKSIFKDEKNAICSVTTFRNGANKVIFTENVYAECDKLLGFNADLRASDYSIISNVNKVPFKFRNNKNIVTLTFDVDEETGCLTRNNKHNEDNIAYLLECTERDEITSIIESAQTRLRTEKRERDADPKLYDDFPKVKPRPRIVEARNDKYSMRNQGF